MVGIKGVDNGIAPGVVHNGVAPQAMGKLNVSVLFHPVQIGFEALALERGLNRTAALSSELSTIEQRVDALRHAVV